MDANGKILIMSSIKISQKTVGSIEIFLLLKVRKQEDLNINSLKLKEWRFNQQK